MKMEKLVVDIELYRERQARGGADIRNKLKISTFYNFFSGQVYHIGSHLPGWFKSLLPASALTVEERAWWDGLGKLKLFLVQ